MRLLGNIEAKLDAKGRVFLPSVFRKQLQAAGEERLVMRKDIFQQCLTLYPESVWYEQLDTLRSRLNRWNKEHQMIYRQFLAEAEPVQLDGNGRFLISKRCMQTAGISQDVRFIGMNDYIEIWSNDNAYSPFMDADAFGSALESIMNNEEDFSCKPGGTPSSLELSRSAAENQQS